MTIINVPDNVRSGELAVVASVSGGKDSTALILALREAEVESRYVFADTGWEAPETYGYLDELRRLLGIQIDVVGVPGGMVGKIRHRAGFPARMQRWCTRELKLIPLREYHDRLIKEAARETISVMGVRAEESAARAKMAELEDEPEGDRLWGGWLWRPLLAWSVADVLAIHHRHAVPVNPLYLRGHGRVGCFPCIYATKEEVALVARHAPERIAEIRALETECDGLRAERNLERPGRYAHMKATFFQVRHGVRPMGIDEVVQWSGTTRGGRQLQIFEQPPVGGCMRWGMCEPPEKP